jgi:hypothetical protein
MRQFSGIAQKLVRAKENILNFEAEVSSFFEEGDYPILPEENSKFFFEAIEYHRSRKIPTRFGVLTGEVVHHLRSCFDHIVWQFSTGPTQNNIPVEFPVFSEKPVKKDTIARFEGKIQRITDANVRALIEDLQPYNAINPTHDPLWIIHDFDIIDKHRELVLCIGTGSIVFPPAMEGVVNLYEKEHPELDAVQIARHFKRYGTAKPSISFRNFSGRELRPVIPGLTQLFNYTVDAVKRFEVL